MFIGHFGVGLAAKRAAPQLSLGMLFLAAQWLDLLWPTLLLLGVESVAITPGVTRLVPFDFTHYPFSHSLLAVVGWSVLLGAVGYWLRRSVITALIIGGLVTSHWLLDALTHRPDLPLMPGGAARIGFGLWNHPILAIPIESVLFAAGLMLYLGSTQASDRVGSIALWSLVGFLVMVYIANLIGPLPPSVEAVAWAGQAQWLLVIWGFWVDRHRSPVA